MSQWIRTVWVTVLWLWVVPTAHAEDKAGSVAVTLIADQTAATPGSSVELALMFEIEDEWHIYWRNRGEGGLESTFKWHVPEGFTVGPVRYPPPDRHVDGADTHTFILEGEPILLARLDVPKSAKPGAAVDISVDVTWLVCREMCYQGAKTVSMKLPIVASLDEVKPAHKDDFEFARSEIPLPQDKATFLDRIVVRSDAKEVKPGETFDVHVILEVEKGYHINSHKPLSEFFIATDLFHDSSAGLWIERPKFPEGELEEMEGLDEKLSIYRGKVDIVLPIEAEEDLAGDSVTVSGIVVYQACKDETGQCFPRAAAEWSLTLPVTGGKPLPADPQDPADDEQANTLEDSKGPAIAATDATASGSSPGSRQGGGFDPNAQVKSEVAGSESDRSLAVWLFFALIAGLILNITPCVLPVISIKVLSFVQQASESPGMVFRLGLAFSVGMLAVFNVLAVMATGLGLVWGQHFQSPSFTIAMAVIVFAFGLSLFGVFTIGVPRGVGDLAAMSSEEGYTGSLAKGALATLMGTPCIGPFLGPVLVWSASQPTGIVFLVFNTIGVGMALPYVLLTANPNWLRFVPKPGPWLTTFKQAMGFLLMATVVYLLFILEGQLGGESLVWFSGFLVCVGLICWIYGTYWTVDASSGGKAVVLASMAVILGVSGAVTVPRILVEPVDEAPAQAAVALPDPWEDFTFEGELPWVDFSTESITQYTAQGKTVFLDITAKWCPNCIYNKKVVFDTRAISDVLARHSVVPILADWTKRGPTIGRLIDLLAPGSSIPICAVFPADRPNEPIVMLGTVTQSQVIEAIERAVAPGGVASR